VIAVLQADRRLLPDNAPAFSLRRNEESLPSNIQNIQRVALALH